MQISRLKVKNLLSILTLSYQQDEIATFYVRYIYGIYLLSHKSVSKKFGSSSICFCSDISSFLRYSSRFSHRSTLNLKICPLCASPGSREVGTSITMLSADTKTPNYSSILLSVKVCSFTPIYPLVDAVAPNNVYG